MNVSDIFMLSNFQMYYEMSYYIQLIHSKSVHLNEWSVQVVVTCSIAFEA